MKTDGARHWLDGIRKVARGKVFVVCGRIESPRLLLHSRSREFQNGPANWSDIVRRGFNDRPADPLGPMLAKTRGAVRASALAQV